MPHETTPPLPTHPHRPCACANVAVEKIACLEIDLPPKMKATKVVWGALNEKLIVSYADGTIRTFDPYDGTELEYAQVREMRDDCPEGGREGERDGGRQQGGAASRVAGVGAEAEKVVAVFTKAVCARAH